jgi:hypothetical protein
VALVLAFDIPGAGLNAFAGFGGQYLFSKPVFFQPSMAGCLMLLAIAPFICGCRGGRRTCRAGRFWRWRHDVSDPPDLVIAVAVALFAASVADLTQHGWAGLMRRLGFYALGGVLVLGAVLWATPSVVAIGTAGAEVKAALARVLPLNGSRIIRFGGAGRMGMCWPWG